MKLHPQKFATATATSFALIWLICSFLVMIMPAQLMHLSGAMLHTGLSWQWDMHLHGLIIGMIAWSLAAWVTAWMTATIYNSLLDR